MSEVEEVRGSVIAWCFTVDPRKTEEIVDALIAAVRRNERKRIWDKGVTQMVETDDGPHRVFVADARVVDPKEVQQ